MPPELRIINDALWERVQTRLHAEAAVPARDAGSQRAFWDRRRPRHLLSGKVICGVGGGPYHPAGSGYLGCQAAKYGACTNRRTMRRTSLEVHVMEILSRQVMRPDLLTALAEAFNAEWQRLDGKLREQAVARQRERLAIERKISNLVDVVSDGRASPAILAKLQELEAAQSALQKAEPLARAPCDLARSGPDMATNYATRIAELTSSLIQGDDPEALEIARGLIDQVIIHPPSDDDPVGIEFIGNLIDLLKAAGLGGTPSRGQPDAPDPALELFVSSVKKNPGAEPLALPASPDCPGCHRLGSRRVG